MTISDFKEVVASYINREASSLDVGSLIAVDKLLLAANNAKLYAQRRRRFQKTQIAVTLSVNVTTGGDLSTAVEAGTSNPVVINSIEQAYVLSTGGAYYPIEFLDKGRINLSIKALTGGLFNPVPPSTFAYAQKLYRQGDSVQLWPWVTGGANNVSIGLDVYQFMQPYGVTYTGSATSGDVDDLIDVAGDYINRGIRIGNIVIKTSTGERALVTGVTATVLTLTVPGLFPAGGETYSVSSGVDTDFFLDNCTDWMLYRSIQELNLFLKEDQRVVISAGMMKDAWDSVMDWDSTLSASSKDTFTLD